ncbi:MAG: diaminopimelate epimerase, partial [Propionibacteriaceae bacterium]
MGGRSGGRGAAAGTVRAARRGDGVARPRLPPGAPAPRRRDRRDHRARGDRRRHAPLRAAPGRLVPQGRADHLARPRPPRPGRGGARRRARRGTGRGPCGRLRWGRRRRWDDRGVRRWRFSKGHGTQNDFVVLLDRENVLDPTPDDVRWLCDRRAGIGGDGLLRAVLARHVPEWDGDPGLWFMDYRNADGSVAQMCGNGVRVFVRYLLDEGLASGPDVDVATRAGLKPASVLVDGRVRVGMGTVRVDPGTVRVTTDDGTAYDATPVDVGNPHAVSFVPAVAGVDLVRAPVWAPGAAFPEGVNLEFVEPVGERHVAMRVFERGVGETRSCG